MTIESMDMTPNYNAMPIGERTDFERLHLIPAMLGADFETKSKQEQLMLKFKWVEQYGRIVGDIMDNEITAENRDSEKNEKIRELLFSHQYQEACEMILPMIVQIVIQNENIGVAA